MSPNRLSPNRTTTAWIAAASAIVGLCTTAPAGQRAPAGADEQVLEIRLIERPVGVERTRYSRDDGGHRLDSTLEIVDRGTPLGVTSQLTVAADFTPRAFAVTGKTYRFVNVDTTVVVSGEVAETRNGATTERSPMRGPFFVARGYAPLAARAWLVRYWEGHGRPTAIASLPQAGSAPIHIDYRGDDRVSAGGRTVRLRRYAVDGVVWGRETVWLDDADRLAAIVTRIHILPMEAIRTDLREAFDTLQASAIADRMKDLVQMRQQLPPIAAGAFALVGARVVSGAGRPMDDATIVVRDGRIAAVGPRASTAVPAGVPTVPASGKTVVPGLWDMHAHASNIEWAPAYLAAGVTTVRDMGGEMRYLTAFRDTLAAGGGWGPRVLLAGLVDGAGDGGFGTTTAGTADEGRTVVERYQAAGFVQMKLYTLLTPPVVAAITARAHALAMTVTGHVPRALTAEQGVEAGMDQIAHLPVRGGPDSPESRSLIGILARHRTVVDPTLAWTELLGRSIDTPLDTIEPAAARVPGPLAENYRSVSNARSTPMTASLKAVKALFDAGVPIVAGTDGAIPGLSVIREVELFVRAGLTPQQAIDAATRVPAAAMGLLADSGTIEVGKRADLLVLDADPLIDIANLRRAHLVAVAGTLVDVARVAAMAGFAPPQ